MERINSILSKRSNKIILGLVVALVVVLIVIYFTDNRYNMYSRHITGMWVGDEAFCETSNASSMLLCIGDEEPDGILGKKRKMHLLINDDIANQTIDIKYRPSNISSMNTIPAYTLHVTCEHSEEKVLGDKVSMEFDMVTGCMRIYDDETLYGVFYRDNETSDYLQDED